MVDQRNLGPVFQCFDQFGQKGVGLKTIQYAVVNGEADKAHRFDGDDILTINFLYFDALFNLSNAKDG